MLKLFTYWISPFWKSKVARCFSARKCSVSNASAWASVIGGISADRGWARNPVKYLRAYWISTRSGVLSVASWWYSRGRRVYGLFALPNLWLVSILGTRFHSYVGKPTHLPANLEIACGSDQGALVRGYCIHSNYWIDNFRLLLQQDSSREERWCRPRLCGRPVCLKCLMGHRSCLSQRCSWCPWYERSQAMFHFALSCLVDDHECYQCETKCRCRLWRSPLENSYQCVGHEQRKSPDHSGVPWKGLLKSHEDLEAER